MPNLQDLTPQVVAPHATHWFFWCLLSERNKSEILEQMWRLDCLHEIQKTPEEDPKKKDLSSVDFNLRSKLITT